MCSSPRYAEGRRGLLLNGCHVRRTVSMPANNRRMARWSPQTTPSSAVHVLVFAHTGCPKAGSPTSGHSAMSPAATGSRLRSVRPNQANEMKLPIWPQSVAKLLVLPASDPPAAPTSIAARRGPLRATANANCPDIVWTIGASVSLVHIRVEW